MWINDPRFPADLLRLLEVLYEAPTDELRERARERLEEELGPPSVPMLLFYARSEGDHFRRVVRELIGKLHPEGLTGALAEGVLSDDGQTRRNSFALIRSLGHEAAPCAGALVESMRRFPDELDGADAALAAIGPAAVPALCELIAESKAPMGVREAAMIAAGDCLLPEGRPGATEAGEELARAYIAVLADGGEEEGLRRSAAEGLFQLGPLAAPVAAELKDLSEKEDHPSARLAGILLEHLEDPTGDADLLWDEDEE